MHLDFDFCVALDFALSDMVLMRLRSLSRGRAQQGEGAERVHQIRVMLSNGGGGWKGCIRVVLSNRGGGGAEGAHQIRVVLGNGGAG